MNHALAPPRLRARTGRRDPAAAHPFRPPPRSHVMAVHQGVRPFACSAPGCAASFAAASDRDAHEAQVHRRERPFECQLCTKVFARRSHLRSHQLKMHPALPHD